MGFSLTVAMPGEKLLSANQRNDLHWAARNRLSKRINKDLFYLTAGKRPTKPLQRARVIIQSRRARLLDPDNLVAGAKPYIDAFVKNGVLVDDRPDNVCLKIVQAKTNKDDRGVIIRISEVQTE